jgi:L-fuculose-phosphate aldolase
MDHADARRLLVQHANRLLPLGLATGSSGNLSVRADDLGPLGGMLVTPSGIAYDSLAPEDMVPVRFTGPGTAAWQHALAPSSEWQMHQAVYQARPEAGAVVHGHPTYATVLAIQGLAIGPLHYMIAAAGGPSIRCAPYFTYGTPELSQAAVAALAGRKACLLAHHGLLAFERNLDRAMWLAGEVETLAQQTVMCMALGGPRLLPEAEIATVVDKFSHYGLQAKPAEPAAGPVDGVTAAPGG